MKTVLTHRGVKSFENGFIADWYDLENEKNYELFWDKDREYRGVVIETEEQAEEKEFTFFVSPDFTDYSQYQDDDLVDY